MKRVTLCIALCIALAFTSYGAIHRDLQEKDYKVYYIACLDKGGNYDVNLLISVNQVNHEIRLVSILRDTDVNGSKINSYHDAKCKEIQGIFKNEYGINVDAYVTIRWKDAIKVLSEFSKQTVTLTENERYYINAYIHETCLVTGVSSDNPALKYIDNTKSTVTLDPLQLVAYCRLRYGASDYKRTANQRVIVSNLIKEMKGMSLTQLGKLFIKYAHCLNTNFGLKDFNDVMKAKDSFTIKDTCVFPDANLIKSVDYHLVPIDYNKFVSVLHGKLFDNYLYKPKT